MAVKKSQEQIISEFVSVHEDKYDYSNVIYKNMHTPVEIICKSHGSFYQQPRAHKNGQGCPKCNISINWVPSRNTESFIKRAIEVHGPKYDYSKTKYFKTMDKVSITCKVHGPFEQLANSHLNGRGCPKCANNMLKDTERFIEEAKKTHKNRYDYSCSEYINSTQKISIICRKHGVFEQNPSQHLGGQGCPKCGIELIKKTMKKDEKLFIAECANIHDNKYDYSKTTYTNRSSNITIICPTHGEFEQRASEHLRGYGCPQCAGNQQLTTSQFIEKAERIHHNRYNYKNSIYTRSKDNISINCQKHGSFTITAGYHLQGGGCPACSLSTQQHQIFEFVNSTSPEINVRLNDRTAIAPFELDILINNKFAIEFNGNYYHSYNTMETTEERLRHKTKVDLANQHNITLMQINSHDWSNNQELVKSMIRHRLGYSTRIFGRKCACERIKNAEASDFFHRYHISGHRHAKINYGLFYENRLVSVINFSKNRDDWEIIRYATLTDHVVVGGLSKLLAAFTKEYSGNIITFVDRRYGNGNGYIKAGFKLIKTTRPGYIYLDSNCKPAGSRIKFQKHKLPNILQYFDPDLTEAENMFNNGYRRMWDAGHHKMKLITY